MRQFIVSDLHGNGKVYYSIINYLNNVDDNSNVTLYINGDLIDRGCFAGEMLVDVHNRIVNNIDFKIEYLAGNHEIMMYNASRRLEYGQSLSALDDIWRSEGAELTIGGLDFLEWDEFKKICDDLKKLKVYHKFGEEINGKKIVLAHAKCPRDVYDKCHLFLGDHNIKYKEKIKTFKVNHYGIDHEESFKSGYYEYDFSDDIFLSTYVRLNYYPFEHIVRRLGNDHYFTIVGHTPNVWQPGFSYDIKDNVLNIDGGSSVYEKRLENYCLDEFQNSGFNPNPEDFESINRDKLFDFDHVPLVEILDNKLRILIFNRLNQIIDGYYFVDNSTIKIDENELNEYRKYLEENKVKKLVKM